MGARGIDSRRKRNREMHLLMFAPRGGEAWDSHGELDNFEMWSNSPPF